MILARKLKFFTILWTHRWNRNKEYNQQTQRSAPGRDGISSKNIKLITDSISYPLANVINLPFEQGVFPDELKIAVITPLYKAKDPISSTTTVLSHFYLCFLKSLNASCSMAYWILSTHWGRATHICVGKLTTIGSDNGLSPGRRQAIIWTIAGILLLGPLGTYFSEILIRIQTFSFKKMHLKMSSAIWRPFVSAWVCQQA